jgi:ribonuclease P protein component
MIANKYRFHGHGSLRFVYKNGQVVRTHLLTVKYSHNPHRTHPRFAIVVSKKVLKSSVGRNRIRRRIYEAIRQSIDDTANSYDIVFIVSSSEIINMPPGDLLDMTKNLLSQTGVYKEKPKTAIL